MRSYEAEAKALPVRRFDRIMHDFLIESFAPHYGQGASALELGSFRGDFTRRLCEVYPLVTAVDASLDCVNSVRNIGQYVEAIHGTFEDVKLEEKFDAIFAIHCLEHVSEPQKVLARIRDEWLEDDGLLFIAVPNAMAASRRLAVRMGLLANEEDVMPAEAAHGHKRSYVQETFRVELMESKLEIMELGGVFWKPLSGEQFDRALQEGIVGMDYMDACYELGKEMPLLCNSVYAICRKWL